MWMQVQQVLAVWVYHLMQNQWGASQKYQVLPWYSFESLTLYLICVLSLEDLQCLSKGSFGGYVSSLPYAWELCLVWFFTGAQGLRVDWLGARWRLVLFFDHNDDVIGVLEFWMAWLLVRAANAPVMLAEDIGWYSVKILRLVLRSVGTERMPWSAMEFHFTLFARMQMLTMN